MTAFVADPSERGKPGVCTVCERFMIVGASGLCVWCTPHPEAIPERPMLGQDAAEAQRLAFGGRRIDLLKESREFDSSRLEANGLFPPKQRGMFGE